MRSYSENNDNVYVMTYFSTFLNALKIIIGAFLNVGKKNDITDMCLFLCQQK